MNRSPSTPTHTQCADFTSRLIQAWSEPGELTGMVNWYRAAIQLKSHLQPVDPIVKPKTLVIWGVHDTALSFELAEITVKDYLKDGRLIPLQATHWVQHDQPAEVTKHLAAFFEEPL